MQQVFSLNLNAILIFVYCVVLGFGNLAIAQQNPPASPKTVSANSSKTVDEKNADVSITANVTAKELKFETVPNPKVEFPGKPERITVWEAERQNLPSSVQPGVTYRNIGIQLKIVSVFADIDRIVAEALGEVPVSESTDEDSNKQVRQSGGDAETSSDTNRKTSAKIKKSGISKSHWR